MPGPTWHRPSTHGQASTATSGSSTVRRSGRSFGARRRLLLLDLPHAERRATAQRHQRDHRPDGHARASRSGAIADMATNRHFCEVFFTTCGCRSRTSSVSKATRSSRRCATRARTRRHRPAGVAIGHCSTSPSSGPIETDPLVRQEIACARDGLSVRAACSCTARSSSQAPAGFSAATKCFCTEHEWRVAEFVAKVLGAEACWNDVTAGLAVAPGYTIMGGTSDVMRNILGERGLGLPREPRA